MKAVARLTFLFIVIVPFCSKVFADGKLYIGESVPADIPYQRAFLIFHENQETLILQSKYELSQSADVNSLGWVVPVPSVPEIASVDADKTHEFFFWAAFRSSPNTHKASFLIIVSIIIASISVAVICIILRPFLNRLNLSEELWSRIFNYSLGMAMVFFVILLFAPALQTAGSSSGVEIVTSERAGIYDVNVIKGENADAIIGWLKENGFNFNENDITAFDDYINRKWCFVVAKVRPEPGTEQKQIISGRMVAPLILKFSTEKAVYPLALTSIIGKQTEILIYTLSDNKLDCDKRLKLRYAGHSGRPKDFISPLLTRAEQETIDFFSDIPESMFFCKFKSKLSPEQMKQDIVFETATDNKPYNETKIVW